MKTLSELDPDFNYTKENIYPIDDYVSYKNDTGFNGNYLEWLKMEYELIKPYPEDYGIMIKLLHEKIQDVEKVMS